MGGLRLMSINSLDGLRRPQSLGAGFALPMLAREPIQIALERVSVNELIRQLAENGLTFSKQ